MMLNLRLAPPILVSLTLLCLSWSNLACSSKKEKALDVKALMEARCSTCHFSTNIYAVNKSPEQWATCVERMRRINPALMSTEECELITAYLQEQQGN